MNCTVHVQKDGCDVWVGTQIPGVTQAVVAKVTGLKPEQVRIHNHLLGGGFGRRLEFDGSLRAVQIAQQVEGPVQVIWTREEDIQHDMYRPYYYDRISAGLDAQGKPIGWSHRIAGSSIMARFFPAALKNGVDPDAVDSRRQSRLRRGRHPRRVDRTGAAGHPDRILARRRVRRAAPSCSKASSTNWQRTRSRIRSPTGWRCSKRARGRKPCSNSPPTRPAGANRCPRDRAAASRCAPASAASSRRWSR